MDIGNWLRSLGLGQYESAFRENEVDGELLPDLSEGDLEKLGVKLGHRKRLLRAIASLSVAGGLSVATAPSSVDTADRRQVTVMFADLVGSTELSVRLDPEDMRSVIGAYQDACSGVVARYDGFLAQFMGDGILAYFGYPRAHEDDAERAVRAGLEIVAAVGKLETRAQKTLRVRIGIATGLVVTGDAMGSGPAQEQARVVGETPNLAARMQSLAEPGDIIVAASTRRLLGELFRLRSLGLQNVKGFGEPIEVWAVEGIAVSASRFDAAHSVRLSGFVGREEERAMLRGRQRQAWCGEGQVVLISGEAGVGKSRFAAWAAEKAADEPHTRLLYQCSPYHCDSALYPFIAQIERAAEIRPEDAPDAKLEKLEAMLSLPRPSVAEIAPLFASLLSIPFGSRYAPLRLSPTQQRRRTLAALLERLEGLARQNPVLALFEDAHWADATSLEMLELMFERVRRLRVLVLITYRPEFAPPWAGSTNVTRLALGRLDRGQAESLVEQVTGGRKLPAEVMAQIVAKTDGVPLFLEELTKTVRESGLLVEEGGSYRLDRPLPPLAIPATLQDSLMARLDRLAPVKEIAQIGAAIGREFSYALIIAVAGRAPAVVADALAQLEGAELLFRTGAASDARYSFKHALVQDTAYESLLKSRRQILHRHIAETLRSKFPAVATAEPETLAHHFTEAGLTQSAFEWWAKAGEQALRRSAYVEAVAHFGKAVRLAEDCESGPAHLVSRLRLQIAYGQALIAARGHGAPETTAAFLRARELSAEIEDPAERFPAYYGLWVGGYSRGDLATMRDMAATFLSEAMARPTSAEACIAHRLSGVTDWYQGDYAGARTHLDRAVALYDPARDSVLGRQFGQDIGVSATICLAIVLWPLGELDRARSAAETAMAQALRSGHVPTIAYAYAHFCIFDLIRRDVGAVTRHASSLLSLSHEHGLPPWSVIGALFRGWADARAGRQEGLKEMRSAVQLSREQLSGTWLPFLGALQAEVEADGRELEAAFATLDDALAGLERTGQRWPESELHRCRGNLLLRTEPAEVAGAEAAFRRAVASAQAQGTRSFELRATIDLAQLLRARGAGREALALLAPICGWFAEGFETPELTAGKALLKEMA